MVTLIGNDQNIEGADFMNTWIIKSFFPISERLVVITVSTFPTKVMMFDGPDVIVKPISHAKGGHR